MEKINVSARLHPVLVQKVQEVADDHYGGDRTAAIAHLLSLGLEGVNEGKTPDAVKHNLEPNTYLAIKAEVKREVMSATPIYFEEVFRRLEELEKQMKRKQNR